MLYLSKLFLLHQFIPLRCLHRFVIFTSVVALTGCESIRINDVSSSGYRTLFYVSEANLDASKLSAKPLLQEPELTKPDLPETEVLQENVRRTKNELPSILSSSLIDPIETRRIGDQGLQQKQTSDSSKAQATKHVQIAVENVESNVKVDQVTNVSSFDFLAWLNALFDSPSEPVSDLPQPVNEKQVSESIAQDINKEVLVAQINTLTETQPTSAGTKPELISNNSAQERKNTKTSALNKKVKSSLRKAELEILSWQLEMQRSKDDRLQCRLNSPTLQLDSDDYTTQLWLNIENNQLTLNATTHIDPNLPFVGIYLDNGHIEKFITK